jgi:hypothetical protein
MTPETREVILKYLAEKYPKSGKWDMSKRLPVELQGGR